MESASPHYSMTNLSPQEHIALKSLSQNHNIIIKPADKGGVIVIQDKPDYLRKAACLLSDSNTYERLKMYPLPKFTVESNQIVTNAQTKVTLS